MSVGEQFRVTRRGSTRGGVALLLGLALGGAGCEKKAEPTPKDTTIAGYCEPKPCNRFEQSHADVVARTGPGSGCFLANAGRCGDLKYIEFSDGYHGYTEFFDAKGTMVGAKRWSDISPKESFGRVPDCKLEITEEICKRDDAG
ncbi:MAG: hypothetical protein R3B13_21215 [Polyangiaceae bacterium]